MPAFKFDSQTFFLTYPQSDFDFDELVQALRTVCDLQWARVCRELHEDGQPHIHVVGRFTKRVQSRVVSLFDFAGRHPNIQPVRSIHKSLAYVAKDGQFRDFGTVPVANNRRSIQELIDIASSSSELEYYAAAAEARVPYQYAQRFRQLSTRDDTITEDYTGDITRERFDVCLQACEEGRTTVIIGPSGIGKTSWAKRVAPKPALWVRHLDVLRQFQPNYHKSIIFDDMSFDHMPRTTQIHLVDTYDDAHIHCRYGHATIPAGVTRIFTANYMPFVQDPAIDRRIIKIDLN